MPGKKKKSDASLQIGGNVSVTRGDFIAGGKNIRVDKGGVYAGGDIHDSNIVTGNNNRVGNQEAAREELFAELIEKIEQRPNTSAEDKEDFKANVAEIKAEAEKGENADESFLSRRLRNLERMAPDITSVLLATLTNPVAGFATLVAKIAHRAQQSASAK